MDFYTILKPEIEKAVSVFAEQPTSAKKKLAKTENRLLDEKALLGRLVEQKEKLTSLSDESLAGSDNDYEKFKVSLKKVNAQIEVTSEAVKVLESRIIPAQRKEVEQAGQKLASELRTFCLNHKGACEVEMSKLLDEIVKLQDSLLDAFDRLCADYGFRFNNNDGALNPEPKHKRIESLSIIELSARQRAAAIDTPTKPAMPPESAQDAKAPIKPTIPPEGIISLPEAGSQAVEAQNPPGEASLGKPETPAIVQTVLTG